MHKHQLLVLGHRIGMGAGLFQGVAMQHHLGTKAARALHLDTRREARHHDHRPHTQLLRMVGHALGMVARAHRDDAPCTLLGVQLHQLVAGTALLERRRELQVLELEIDLGAHDLGQRVGVEAGRALDLALDALRGIADVLDAEHGMTR